MAMEKASLLVGMLIGGCRLRSVPGYLEAVICFPRPSPTTTGHSCERYVDCGIIGICHGPGAGVGERLETVSREAMLDRTPSRHSVKRGRRTF